MRGIPGSGKSTVARQLAGTTGVIHSVDEYLYENGEYKFNAAKLPELAERVFKDFSESIANGVPIVVYDRGNLTKASFEAYVRVAEKAGYIVSIVTLPKIPLELSVQRNIHNVPEEMIREMIQKWED